MFCRKCGAELLYVERDYGFALMTGERNFRVHLVCPNRRHFLDGHSQSGELTFSESELKRDFHKEHSWSWWAAT